VEGKKYIDYMCALGPVILGYNDADVRKALLDGVTSGLVSMSAPTPVEVVLAECLCQVTGHDMVRFGKNGADATAAAVRLAKAWAEGRGAKYSAVLRCGYHGYHDWAIDAANPEGIWSTGKYGWVESFPYGDLTKLQDKIKSGDYVAVIMEPVLSQDPQYPPMDYLADVRWLCDKYNVLLIFDEVFTFGRFEPLTASQFFAVQPDLLCISKGMANGMPLSAVLGYSTTFGGEALSLAASLATITKLVSHNVPKVINERGDRLRKKLQWLANDYNNIALEVTPYGAHHLLRFADAGQCQKFQTMCRRMGVLLGMHNESTLYHNISYAHTDAIIDETLAIYDAVMSELDTG
jgi:glutamate-1-semialdehyde aminotransferase